MTEAKGPRIFANALPSQIPQMKSYRLLINKMYLHRENLK